MYEQHFGLTERPFSIAPDPRFLYMSPQHREALAHLLFGVGSGGGFVQLTGEVGTGKTTICRCLVEQLPDDVDIALILNPRISGLELVASLCDELKILYPKDTTSIKVLTDALNAYLLTSHANGRRTVLILDEAQSLSAEALEEVRLLTNLETTREKLLQIVLVGQPELRDLLARDDLRQLAQRITARYHLLPISRDETGAYIHHRLQVCGSSDTVFKERAIDMVHKLSQGIPRLINILCDRAMLGAFVEGRHEVDTAVVRKAAREVLPEQRVDAPAKRRWPWAVAALLLLGLGLGVFLNLDRLPRFDLAAILERTAPDKEPTTLASAGRVASAPVSAEPLPAPLEPGPVEEAQPASESVASAPPIDPPQADASPVEPPQADSFLVGPPQADPSPVEPVQPDSWPVEPTATAAALVEPVLPEPSQIEVSEPESPTPVTEPDPPMEYPLADGLNAAGTTASARAWAGLYRLWGYDSEAVTDEQACAQAPAAGLRCIQAAGSWGILQRFDRPAILLLVSGAGRWVPVLLRYMTGQSVGLEIDGQELEVPRSELEKHWYGEYRLLWQTPPSGVVALRPGNRSNDVRWLRERLARIVGESAAAADPRRYDAEMKAMVESIQREQGLTADGVAGARTFIMLNNLDEQANVPRLRMPPVEIRE
jgi:general secretion pathway protein A